MIKENLILVEEKITSACQKSGRDRSEIRLIAVSKTQPSGVIIDASKAGLVNFGENKAQELRDKFSELKEKICWHFVGHLQTNKVKYVIEPAEYIHSVDSIKLAEEISRKATQINKVQKILLEVNSSLEATKYGLSDGDEILSVAHRCRDLENLNLVGLMTMAPLTDNELIIRKCFIKLRELKDKLNGSGLGLTELSMGMTNDFEIAIEEGATMLRIGTAIFGSRN